MTLIHAPARHAAPAADESAATFYPARHRAADEAAGPQLPLRVFAHTGMLFYDMFEAAVPDAVRASAGYDTLLIPAVTDRCGIEDDR